MLIVQAAVTKSVAAGGAGADGALAAWGLHPAAGRVRRQLTRRTRARKVTIMTTTTGTMGSTTTAVPTTPPPATIHHTQPASSEDPMEDPGQLASKLDSDPRLLDVVSQS